MEIHHVIDPPRLRISEAPTGDIIWETEDRLPDLRLTVYNADMHPIATRSKPVGYHLSVPPQ